LEADLPFAAFCVFAMDYPIVYWLLKCLSASRNVGEICGGANWQMQKNA
jgi:hypothetical protein